MKITTGVIESRSDGSYIYMSKKGILNIDTYNELQEIINDEEYPPSHGRRTKRHHH